jgi:hypothetical protein
MKVVKTVLLLQIVGNITIGNAHRGRISLGCEYLAIQVPVPGSSAIPPIQTGPSIIDASDPPILSAVPPVVGDSSVPALASAPVSPSGRTAGGSPTLNISYFLGTGQRMLSGHFSTVTSNSGTARARSPSPVSQVKRIIENRDDGADDFRSVISNFTGIIMPPMERPCVVRVHSIALYDLPSLHVLLPNSPVVFLSFGEWRAKTSEAHRAGTDAEWSSLDVHFTIPVDIEDKFPSMTVLVRSGSQIAGAVQINIDELLSMPRKRDGHVILTEVLKTAEESNRGRIRIDISFERLRPDGSSAAIASSNMTFDSMHSLNLNIPNEISTVNTVATPSKLLPEILTAKMSVRMITLMELANNVTGSVRASAANGPWKGNSLVRTSYIYFFALVFILSLLLLAQAFPVISHMTAMTDLTWDRVPLYEHTPLEIHFILDSNDRTVGVFEVSTREILAVSRDDRENFTVMTTQTFLIQWDCSKVCCLCSYLEPCTHQSGSSSQRMSQPTKTMTL